MIWLVLASLFLGPFPDQLLIYAFKDGTSVVDRAGTMPADACFQRAANETRFLYTYYGPFVFHEMEVVFCITPPK